MASIRKRYTDHGTFVYYLDFRYRGQRIRRSSKTSDRKMALAAVEKIKSMIVQGLFKIEQVEEKNKSLREMTDEYVNGWCVSHKANGTVIIDKLALRDLMEFIGKATVARNVGPAKAEEFSKWLSKRISGRSPKDKNGNRRLLSPATINMKLRSVRAAFNWAKRNGYVDTNPFANVEQFRVDETVPLYVEPEHLTKIFEEIRKDPSLLMPRFEQYISMLLLTGCRKMEALNLVWRKVDLERNFVSFDKTKTNEERKIPMNDELRTILLDIRSKSLDTSDTGKVFPELTEDFVTKKFKKMVSRAKVPSHYHLHCLRHTAAFLMRLNDVKFVDIKDILGHRDFRTTLRYSKIRPEHLRPSISLISLKEFRGGQENNT